MPRISKADVMTAFQRASNHLEQAAGGDGRISRADIKDKLATLEGKEKALVDMYSRVLDRRDAAPGATLTKKDLRAGLAFVAQKMVAKYDVNQNGLSKSEISKMSNTAKIAVSLAKELKAAGALSAEIAPRTDFDAAAFAADVKAAAGDYWFISESDSPVITVTAPHDGSTLTEDIVRAAFADKHDALCSEAGLLDFPLATAESDWRDIEDVFGGTSALADAPSWADIDENDPDALAEDRIKDVLYTLDDMQVFAFAEKGADFDAPGSVAMYAVGLAPDGSIAGVMVGSVET